MKKALVTGLAVFFLLAVIPSGKADSIQNERFEIFKQQKEIRVKLRNPYYSNTRISELRAELKRLNGELRELNRRKTLEKREQVLSRRNVTSPVTKVLSPTTKALSPVSIGSLPEPEKIVFETFEWGKASYYADMFNGRRTASGEVFSNNELTAAHRSLPFGTMVKVRNPDNGNTVEVMINDRGPYVSGRIIDLSSAAFSHLDNLSRGVIDVEIEVVDG